ncbi:uncharacterized protein LOC119840638 [Zerene cesonia]|uniref:uncharacterized protein LOC119840638 n=1 Tax=Zerene cesonia TaxID=33412 RepID=UPI0018E52ED3|nr:uncharacterized protein LOC119840638 [Zerene cesonia]
MRRGIFILCLSKIIVSAYEIGVPKITSVSALDPVGFFIQWKGVTSFNKDPVLGYKIRLWKVEEDSQGYLKLVNGEEIPGLLLEDRALEPVDKVKTPKAQPREVVINNVSTQKAKVYNVNYNTLYEIRILAYKMNEDGPLSEPARVKIMKGDAYFILIQKRPGEDCAVSIATNVTISDEPYYHLETVYF